MNTELNNKKKEPLHRALINLLTIHRGKAKLEFNKIGLSQGQPKILDFLLVNDGCIQREIAENCRIKPATVTSLLANMEKDGLIYRTKNISNKRIVNVFLTDSGKKSQMEVERTFYSIDNQCFMGFSEEEKIQTIDLLNRLCENLLMEKKNND